MFRIQFNDLVAPIFATNPVPSCMDSPKNAHPMVLDAVSSKVLWNSHLQKHQCMDPWIGANIKVMEVIPRPFFKYELDTFVEFRGLSWAFENISPGELDHLSANSDKVGSISTESEGIPRRVLDFLKPTMFEDSSISIRIPGRDKVQNCIVCNGQAQRICSRCSGNGCYPCTECSDTTSSQHVAWNLYSHLDIFKGKQEHPENHLDDPCMKCFNSKILKCVECDGSGEFDCKVCLLTGKIRGFCMNEISWKTLKKSIFVHLNFPKESDSDGFRRLEVRTGSSIRDEQLSIPISVQNKIQEYMKKYNCKCIEEEDSVLSPIQIDISKHMHSNSLSRELQNTIETAVTRISKKMHRNISKECQLGSIEILHQRQKLSIVPIHEIVYATLRHSEEDDNPLNLSTETLRNVSMAALSRPHLLLNTSRSNMSKNRYCDQDMEDLADCSQRLPPLSEENWVYESFWVIGNSTSGYEIICQSSMKEPSARSLITKSLISMNIDEQSLLDQMRSQSEPRMPRFRVLPSTPQEQETFQKQTSRTFMPAHMSKAGQLDECSIS